jgi:hypothetical protein
MCADDPDAPGPGAITLGLTAGGAVGAGGSRRLLWEYRIGERGSGTIKRSVEAEVRRTEPVGRGAEPAERSE